MTTSLDPTPPGYAERLATGLHARRPLLTSFGVALVGYLVMAALLLGAALLITRVLSPGPVVTWDNSVNRWFVTIRTSSLNSVTAIGSALGGAPVIIGTALVCTIALAIAKRWKAIAFLITGLVIESAAFLTAATLVTRPRPMVPKLETSPPTSSFPSGHTAAAIVLYLSLAIILGTLTRSRVLTTLAWILAFVLPVFVGVSRMYRGMHHPTDVIGGCVLGVGALLFALLTVRTDGAVRGRAREQDARERVLHAPSQHASAAAVSR